jgi:uncharacterized protein (TIGR00251 family)
MSKSKSNKSADVLAAYIKSGAKIQIIEESANGIIFDIQVKAKPGSKVEKMEIGSVGEFVFAIRAKPVDGEANAALINAVAELFNTAKSNVLLVQGTKSRSKRMRVLVNF